MSAQFPYNGIENIDHPVIASSNLDDARAAFEKLGFTVPPRGSHIEWGTGNLCIMFPDDYVEVRGIIDPERFTMHLDTHLEQHGEGLMGVAFGTRDVKHSYADAQANGVNTGELRSLRRNFEHPEGWTQPAFELFAPDADDIEGLMHVVVIEHLTPELIRRPDFLEHANGCVGIDNIEGTITDTGRCADKLRRLLGDAAVAETSRRVTLTVPSGQVIELTQADEASLKSMTLRAHDLGTVAKLLTEVGVEHGTDNGETVTVGPEHACGTTLKFTASVAG